MKILRGIVVCLFLYFVASSVVAGLQRDIEYAVVDSKSLLLDVFTPDNRDNGPFPVAIIVHGGGWTGGDKQKDIAPICEPLTKAGFVWFSINYRLAPQYHWPSPLEDIKVAIRWVKENASRFKGDPNKIALIGYSAGGHLACMAAVTADEKTQVNAVVGFAPPSDLVVDTLRRWDLSSSLQNLLGTDRLNDKVRQLLWQTSPINHIKPSLPPFLLIHGTEDQIVPYQQSLNFIKRLTDVSVPCELISVNGAPHRITEWDSFDRTYRDKLIGWLHSVLNIKHSGNARKRIIVASDGSGDFTTVQAAIDVIPENNTEPITVFVKQGVYTERVTIPKDKRFVRLIGEDANSTIITFNLNARMIGRDGREIGTFATPTVTIEADDFTAENITFENSFGPGAQAVAVAVLGDRIVFRSCRFLGWQDTLLDQTGRHYYEKCYVAGHCDFIFGGGIAFFEKCHIHCLRDGYITAAATPQHQKYGYVFNNCKITGASPDVRTYLGRPWRDYANFIFLNTKMSRVVQLEGWHNWSRPHREKTSRYAEFNSTGDGAQMHQRVEWARQLTEAQAATITIESVLSGDDGWNPKTGQVKSPLKITPATDADAISLKRKTINICKEGNFVYLSVCSCSDGNEGLYFAYSDDGFEWKKLDRPFLTPQPGTGELMRDMSLVQTPDGMFHLVWTVALRDRSDFGYSCSRDLVDWSPPKFIEVMSEYKPFEVVAPHLFYDEANSNFIIIWASTLPGNYYQAFQEDIDNNPRLWFTTTDDFNSFAPAKIFFEPGYSVKDGFFLKVKEDKYALFHKDNRRMMNVLRMSFSDKPTGPWDLSSNPLSFRYCSNPAVLKVKDDWLVYFATEGNNRCGLLETKDFKNWIDLTEFVTFPPNYCPNSILRLSHHTFEILRSSLR